jgi:ubiquitin-like 1-activating enzyme E1 A
VETVSDVSALDDERFEAIVKTVDLVCVTDWDERGIVSSSIQTSNIERDLFICNQIRMNETCRKHQKPFYAGGSYGLIGYIFCDLLKHDYLTP